MFQDKVNQELETAKCCKCNSFPCCCNPLPVCPTGATGPIGPTGPTGPGGAVAYGGRYNDAIQVITIPALGAAVVDLDEIMPSSNVNLGINNIIITVPGNYKVDFMVVLQSTTGTFGIDVGVRVNGVFSVPSLFLSTVLTSDFEVITVSAIVTLAAGAVLDLAISSATGGTVLFGPSLNANLSVMLLS